MIVFPAVAAAAVNDDKKSRFGVFFVYGVSLPGRQGFGASCIILFIISPIVVKCWWFARGREKENLEHIFLYYCIDLRALFSIVCVFFSYYLS